MRLAAAALAIMTCTLISCSGKESAEEQAANTCGPSPFSVRSSDATQQNSSEILKSKGSTLAGNDDIGEVVGQMSWHLCNARANGWIDDAFYRSESVALRQAIFTKMGVGTAPAPSAETPPVGDTPETSDFIRHRACLKAAGDDDAAARACP